MDKAVEDARPPLLLTPLPLAPLMEVPDDAATAAEPPAAPRAYAGCVNAYVATVVESGSGADTHMADLDTLLPSASTTAAASAVAMTATVKRFAPPPLSETLAAARSSAYVQDCEASFATAAAPVAARYVGAALMRAYKIRN